MLILIMLLVLVLVIMSLYWSIIVGSAE